STAVTNGSSNMIAVTPEAARASSAWPTRMPGMSVSRLRGADMGDQCRCATETDFPYHQTGQSSVLAIQAGCDARARPLPTLSGVRGRAGRGFTPRSRPRLPPGPSLASPIRMAHLASMTADVSIAAALFAGVLSFLSPCVLPLVPPYLVYLAGTSLERLADAEPEPMVRTDTVLAALLFVAGFSTVFIAFGA